MTRGNVLSMPQTASEIIETKGGPAAFAAALGIDAERVRAMKHRNKLPRSVWPEIQTAFPDLTLKVLRASEAAADRSETVA